LKVHTENGLYMPVHYLAVDHSIQKVVISIRGTLSLQDCIVDLVCEPKELDPCEWQSFYGDDNRIKFGSVHLGFWSAAQRLSKLIEADVKAALGKHPNYSLVIVGHSYGGAVASLLCILWAASDNWTHQEFTRRNLHAYAFGAPCAVCSEVSKDKWVRQRVTSVVLGDDIVSRISLASFQEMQEQLVSHASGKIADDQILKGDQIKLADGRLRTKATKKLYCPGQVWHLDPELDDATSQNRALLINPVTSAYLNTIQISPTMFSAHMPQRYVAAMAGGSSSM